MKNRPPMKEIEKAKDFKGTLKKLINYIKHYKLGIIIVAIASTISTIFFIVGPNLLGDVTTEIFEGAVKKVQNTGGIDFTFVNKTLIFLLGLYILRSVFAFISEFIMNSIACKISYNLRKEISEKINKLPMKYFDKYTHGEILSRITNDVDTLCNNLSQSLSQVVSNFVTIVGILYMMISINSNLTIVSILILPISIFGTTRNTPKNATSAIIIFSFVSFSSLKKSGSINVANIGQVENVRSPMATVDI